MPHLLVYGSLRVIGTDGVDYIRLGHVLGVATTQSIRLNVPPNSNLQVTQNTVLCDNQPLCVPLFTGPHDPEIKRQWGEATLSHTGQLVCDNWLLDDVHDFYLSNTDLGIVTNEGRVVLTDTEIPRFDERESLPPSLFACHTGHVAYVLTQDHRLLVYDPHTNLTQSLDIMQHGHLCELGLLRSDMRSRLVLLFEREGVFELREVVCPRLGTYRISEVLVTGVMSINILSVPFYKSRVVKSAES